jgi:hypothetical protein
VVTGTADHADETLVGAHADESPVGAHADESPVGAHAGGDNGGGKSLIVRPL